MKEIGESTTKSTNYLGRALMTPDELRRLDVEKCIIIVKGIYPVMADKFMYFKEPEEKYFLITRQIIRNTGQLEDFGKNLIHTGKRKKRKKKKLLKSLAKKKKIS